MEADPSPPEGGGTLSIWISSEEVRKAVRVFVMDCGTF